MVDPRAPVVRARSAHQIEAPTRWVAFVMREGKRRPTSSISRTARHGSAYRAWT
jgi:hypothetical protein